MLFADRIEAGKRLAEAMEDSEFQGDTMVLALPRGGIPVAFEISRQFELPLNIIFSKKISLPEEKEVALGAIAEHDGEYLNKRIISYLDIPQDYIADERQQKRALVTSKSEYYRKESGLENPKISEKNIILVDDGLATGATMLAAIDSMQKRKARKIIVAIPVSSRENLALVESQVDDVFCISIPVQFQAVGNFYRSFPQLSDEDAINFLYQSVLEMRNPIHFDTNIKQ